jgi:hypothetical protein
MKLSITQTATIFAALLTRANAYNCWRNTDNAARWDDSMSPADRLVQLCNVAGTGERCHQAKIGRMCVDGPGTEAFCNYIWGWAGSQQSFHGNWFLWADITCDGGVLGTADDVHVRML